jgi:hypothetical protein
VLPVAKPLTDTDRVFVTLGSNKAIVEQIQEILAFGKFVPVVALQKESVGEADARQGARCYAGCYAAIVHLAMKGRSTTAGATRCGCSTNVASRLVLLWLFTAGAQGMTVNEAVAESLSDSRRVPEWRTERWQLLRKTNGYEVRSGIDWKSAGSS